MQVGHVYLLANDSMPGLYKIGHTRRNVEDRVAELSSATSVPLPFRVLLSVGTYHSGVVESWCHQKLRATRRSRAREFFQFSDDMEACQAFVSAVGSCGAYHPPSCVMAADATKAVISVKKPEPPVEEGGAEEAKRMARARDQLQKLKELARSDHHGC